MSGINQDEDEIGNILMTSAFSMEENEQLALPLKELTPFISASHVIFLYSCISKQGRSYRAENPAKKKCKVSHLHEKCQRVLIACVSMTNCNACHLSGKKIADQGKTA